MTGTAFNEIYNKFKAKITDDMFMELTPGETDSLLKEYSKETGIPISKLLDKAIEGLLKVKQVL